MVQGRFVTLSGQAVHGVSVIVQAWLPNPKIGVAATPPLLGRTTTARDGSWSFTMPARLPASVQRAVDHDNGVLNVLASASGVGAGQHFQGSQVISVAVGHPSTTVSGHRVIASKLAVYNARPATAAMVVSRLGAPSKAGTPVVHRPATDLAASTVAPEVSAAMGMRAHPEWQRTGDGEAARAGADVVHGVDYSRVVPADDWCYPYVFATKKSTHVWTRVGSEHAWWDATGYIDYWKSASTAIGVMLTASGDLWGAGGGAEQTNTTDMGLQTAHLRPKHAKWIRLQFRYLDQYGTQRCSYGTFHMWTVTPDGWHSTAGAPNYKPGAWIKGYDGKSAYEKMLKRHPGRNTWLQPGSTAVASSGTNLVTKLAANAFGLEFFSQTAWGEKHLQTVRAGSSHSRHHWIWGAKHRPFDRSDPGVIYSY